jgi:hypothetical protein
MRTRLQPAIPDRSTRRGAAALVLTVCLLVPGAVLAQQSTSLVGAGGGTFPADTTYNGVLVTGMGFGMGVDLPAGAPVVGNFEFTLLGVSGGDPRLIVIEGKATDGSGTVGGGVTVFGTATVDMGDGTPPATGLAFMMAVDTAGSGQTTAQMVIDGTSLPPATVDAGAFSVEVPTCVPPLPTLITDSLCGAGSGLIGTHWISLPSWSPLKTAADLCTALGPTATVVRQKFPEPEAPDSTVPGTWSYDCTTHACTPGSTGAPATEPGCPAPDCFCLNPGEGYEVVTGAAVSVDIKGCEGQVPITLPPGGRSYIISVPIQTNLVTFNDLALYIGLTSTGIMRGTVQGLNGCTGLTTSCNAGTGSCSAAHLVPGLAYRVRYTNTNGATFINPTTSTGTCPPPC